MTTLPKLHPAAATLELTDASGNVLGTATGTSPLSLTQTLVEGAEEVIHYDANDHATSDGSDPAAADPACNLSASSLASSARRCQAHPTEPRPEGSFGCP